VIRRTIPITYLTFGVFFLLNFFIAFISKCLQIKNKKLIIDSYIWSYLFWEENKNSYTYLWCYRHMPISSSMLWVYLMLSLWRDSIDIYIYGLIWVGLVSAQLRMIEWMWWNAMQSNVITRRTNFSLKPWLCLIVYNTLVVYMGPQMKRDECNTMQCHNTKNKLLLKNLDFVLLYITL